jgi:transcriptional regulator with XRE-family HTH domain
MHTTAPASTDSPPFGKLLREVRTARRLSQLDLAMRADVSQRHLSFIESGRAQPSREMILQLAQTLDLPLREQNRLLLAAGFAGVYPQRPLNAVDMQPVNQALHLLLQHHEPYPAIVVDRAWNLINANAAMARVLGLLGDPLEIWKKVCPDGRPNILKLTFHPDGLRRHMRNFEEVGAPLLARTAREALEHPGVHAVLEEVLRYPDLPRRLRNLPLDNAALPVIATHFELNGRPLRLFTMLSTFGTPLDVTTDELRVEHMFPADAESEALLRQLAGATISAGMEKR